LAEFRNIYGSEIIPTLKKTKGCRFAYLTENIQEEDDAISVTIWDSKEDADNYEKSGVFEDLTEKVKHTFSNLFQWKMALEKDSQGSKISTSADLKVSHYTMVAGRNFGDIQTK
jgi:heme-degrading monooxygenase HmoA